MEVNRILGKDANALKICSEEMEMVENPHELLTFLKDNGYIDENFSLTEKGRSIIKVGMVGGVFDLIHIGHIKLLEEAKKYVDLLAVVVARDETVEKLKGRRPINEERVRVEVVSKLKPVDVAILGDKSDYTKPVELIKPDIIFLGYDQELPCALKGGLEKIEIRKMNVFVEGYKSSSLIRKLIELTGF
ncbi:MAG: adenylyltransferase/cytidyltransferase family protein [Candidatus Geothermarchaeota archaeon]